MAEVLGRKRVVSRKAHACWWCGEQIEVGDPYERWAWADGGEVRTVRAHPECADDWDAESKACGGGYLEVGFAGYERPRKISRQHGKADDDSETA